MNPNNVKIATYTCINKENRPFGCILNVSYWEYSTVQYYTWSSSFIHSVVNRKAFGIVVHLIYFHFIIIYKNQTVQTQHELFTGWPALQRVRMLLLF